MSFEFAGSSLEQLTSGPLGQWIFFAAQTAPAAAVLAFTFVVLVVSLFWLLLWCAGAPRFAKPVLLITPIVGLFAAVIVGGVMALFVWPVLWLFKQILGLPSVLERSAILVVQVNYLSLGLVTGAALAVVIVLLVHGIWTEPRKVQSAKRGAYAGGGGEYSEILQVRELLKPEDYGRAYRRIAVIVGIIFSAVPVLAGLFLAREGLSLSQLSYCGLAAGILFVVPYAITRSVGWVLDSCIAKMHAGTVELRR